MHKDYGVRLGPINSYDAEILRNWRNCKEIYDYCRQNQFISDMDQDRWIRWQNDDPYTRMFLISKNKTPVGVCGLTSIDYVNSRAEFSLYIAPQNQGRGYGKKSLLSLLSYGFETLGLNLIWGETFEGNPAAKMFESIGFTNEGTRRQFYRKGGKFIAADLYSITSREFEQCRLKLVSS